jgi:hypothetical protein
VETEEFLADVRRILTEDEHDALVWYVAHFPEAGDLIPGTGGLRKLRWIAQGRGKRGGSRVIYYFHDRSVPLFLMAIFAKNVQADISQEERRGLVARLRTLKSDLRQKGKE